MKAGQWYILGLNFENIGAETSFKITDLLAPEKFTSGSLVSGENAEVATQIQIRNADNSASTYFYYNNIMVFEPEFAIIDGWVKEGEEGLGLTTDAFESGTGFWFKQPTGGGTVVLNFAGQVLPADSADIHVKPIWQLAANPFPTALKVKDLASDDLTAGENANEATQIQIRNADNSATTYFYYNNIMVFEPEFAIINGWVKEGEEGFGLTEDTIAPGVGFWIKDPSKTFDIEIASPTAK